MNDNLIALLEYVRNNLDPDEVVEYFSLDTETLVDQLLPVIDTWLAERDGEWEE